ncbi:MAG: MATE family efflux transporter [Afipia sp.]
MSELGAAEIPVVQADEKPPLPAVKGPVKNPLLDGPILSTLLKLAAPNVVALTAGTCVAIAETSYIGRLGVEPLAAMALVFPFVILMMTMSGGAMGGGVASAIARALGANDAERASALAVHALMIGICFGLTFMIGMLIFGPYLFAALGGRGRVLSEAIGYSQIFFGGAVLPWIMNTLAALLRGTGNMKLPSAIILNSAFFQVLFGGVLGLGLGPVPQFGMRGVAAGTLMAFSIGAGIMAWYLLSGRSRVKLNFKGFRFQRAMFYDILQVGAIACFSPLQIVLTVTIFTHLLANFGTEVLAGYGIGARLEFMLTSLAFAVGIASVPMIGMAIGAGRIARARRIAWTAGGVSFVAVGVFGGFFALNPDIWVNIFTDNAAVRAASRQYLSTVGPFLAFVGLAISLYFSSQGAARVIGPVLAQTARLAFVMAGGWWLMSSGAVSTHFFWLSAVSMILLGVLAVAAVHFTNWGTRNAGLKTG